MNNNNEKKNPVATFVANMIFITLGLAVCTAIIALTLALVQFIF
jgi:ABC-type dipeptide/oligopeptide/nickel transport system permease component